MVAAVAVREDKGLLADINLIHKVYVYDQPPPKTDEIASRIAELPFYNIFYNTELERYKSALIVLRNYIGIVSVRLDVNQFGSWNSQQFSPF